MMYLICVISIFVAMAVVLGLIIIGWVRNKLFKVEELVLWLMWFALVMAIVTC
jgi:hypothetical protein